MIVDIKFPIVTEKKKDLILLAIGAVDNRFGSVPRYRFAIKVKSVIIECHNRVF